MVNSQIGADLVSKETSKRLKIDFRFLLLVFIYGLGILQTITGFQQLILNSIFIISIIIIALILPPKDGLKLLPIIIVYLGYTYVEMHSIGGRVVNNTTLTNIYLTIIAVKIIFFYPKVLFKRKYFLFIILGCYLLFQRLSYYLINDGLVSFFAILIMIVFLEQIRSDYSEIKIFVTCFIITIASTYIYNFFHFDIILTNLLMDSQKEAWRSLQFVGMRDPNNIALQANLCLSYILFRDLYRSKKIRNFFIGFLVVTSFITISLSGIFTTISLLFIKCFNNKRKLVWAVILIIVFGIFLVCNQEVINVLKDSNNRVLSSIGLRMSETLLNFQEKNYNRLTSDRTYLWDQYFYIYSQQNLVKQLFGNPLVNRERTGLASHNGWLDLLMNNGIIGLSILIVLIISFLHSRLRIEGKVSWLIVLIFVVNIFARSLDSLMIYLLVL